MKKIKKIDLSLIITACIKPINIPYLERTSEIVRLNDYKISFKKWLDNNFINKIIFIENSGYDLEYFREEAKKYPTKEVEILSSYSNNFFDKSLGKGYGEYLCIKEVFEKSKLAQIGNFFLKISGRYYITNLESIYNELVNKNPDIYVILKNNLKFVDTYFFGGSKKFFIDYVLPSSEKINDTKGIYIEHCVAKAVLSGINDNLKFKHQSVYPFAEGYIGTNNKKIKNNIFKKIKMNLFGKLKNYLINHKKY